jgi:hypothetical protein
MSKSRAQSGTLLKEQSSHDLDISLRGTKGLSKRPTCIGTKSIYCSVHPNKIKVNVAGVVLG